MMMHGTLYPPEQEQYFTSPHATNYLVSILFRFRGDRSLAGPTINALDPLHHFMHGLYMLERRFGQDVRLERIILRGGETPNAVPVEAVTKVWIRSKSSPLLEHAVAAVKKCATSSAEALGAECEVEPEGTVRSVVCNPTLEELAEKNAASLGLHWTSPAPLSAFSTDFGNVSAILPSFYLKAPLGVGRFHTCEAMTNTRSRRALKAMIDAIKLLSLIAIDLLASPQLMRKANKQLESYRKTNGRRR
jgi:metal-dependent amidase/aminoacylase/carboxypeptidase family protein